MATLAPPTLDLSAFCQSLHRWLLAEVASQESALRWTREMGTQLIACNPAGIARAQEAILLWEQEHRPQQETYAALEAEYREETGDATLTVSGVLQRLQAWMPGSDWEWRLAETAGALRELMSGLQRQHELNQLLISQHAEVLQQTWLLFAHALQGTQPGEGGYDDLGQPTTPSTGAALLDARG